MLFSSCVSSFFYIFLSYCMYSCSFRQACVYRIRTFSLSASTLFARCTCRHYRVYAHKCGYYAVHVLLYRLSMFINNFHSVDWNPSLRVSNSIKYAKKMICKKTHYSNCHSQIKRYSIHRNDDVFKMLN